MAVLRQHWGDGRGDTMVVRFTMASPAADTMSAADRQTCTVILRADQDFSNHNGGNIAFGPDGLHVFRPPATRQWRRSLAIERADT